MAEIDNFITTLYQREIELCKTDADLHRVGKLWKKYFAECNKFIAGKREEYPYFSEDGKAVL